MNNTCVYRQVFTVTPLIGGFVNFDDKSSFKTIAYQVGYQFIYADKNNIMILLPNHQAITYYRAIVIFQDAFIPSKGVNGCVKEVEYINNPPTINISQDDEVVLTTGTIIIADHNKLIAKHLNLSSNSNIHKIKEFLNGYIIGYDAASSEDEPSTNKHNCVIQVGLTNLDLAIDNEETFSLELTSAIQCTFISWFVALPGYDSLLPNQNTSNKFTITYPSNSKIGYQVGYLYNDGSNIKTVYSNLLFPIVAQQYLFTPDQIM